MTAPMAVCRVDGEPLVSTMAFIYKEFVCVVCGRTYEFLEPAAAVSTPELEPRQLELKIRWRHEREEDEAAAIADLGPMWSAMTGKEQRACVAENWVKRHG